MSSPHGTVEDDGTSLLVRWRTTNDAIGYIVMATSYTGRLRNETVAKVVLAPPDGSANQELSTSIAFNIECSDKFIFKVAAFNSFGMGQYTEELEVRKQQENCDLLSGKCRCACSQNIDCHFFHPTALHCMPYFMECCVRKGLL